MVLNGCLIHLGRDGRAGQGSPPEGVTTEREMKAMTKHHPGRKKLWAKCLQRSRTMARSSHGRKSASREHRGEGGGGACTQSGCRHRKGGNRSWACGPRGQFPALTFQAERSPTCSGGFGENNMKYQWIGLNLGLNQRPSSTQLWRGQRAIDTEKQNWKYSIPQFYFSVIWKNTTMVWFWW